MSEQSTAPESAPIETSSEIAEDAAGIEEAVHDTESIDMAGSEEGQVDASEASDEVAEQAADKVNAKEVKGSDGELFKIKVDGQELELTREEMIRHAQMGKAGQKAMQQKAELQKQMASFVQALRDNPATVLSEDLGLDIRQLAQEVLAAQLEEEALDPLEKRAREAEAKLEKMLKRQEEERQSREKQEFEQEVAKYEQELEEQVQEAFEKTKLPRNPIFLSRMAEMLEETYNKNLNVTPLRIAEIIKEDWLSETKNSLGSFDDDQLESMLGPDIVSRLRKHSLKKVKTAPSAKSKPVAGNIEAKAPKKAEKIAWKDFIKNSLVKE